MTWYSRSEWTDSKTTCVATLQDVKGVVIHYPGGNLPADVANGDHQATGKYLNGVRSMQMASTKYDYCDIEYSVCADRAGDVWRLRGLTLRSGANGTYGDNMQYPAIFVLVGLTADKQPTKAQVGAVRDVIKRVRNQYPGAKAIRGHRECVPTACPGDVLWGLIQDGTFEPNAMRRVWRKTIHQLKKSRAAISARIGRLRDKIRGSK